jgi:hypothetical protein
MPPTVRVSLGLFTLTAASLPAVAYAQAFEGTVSYQVTTEKGTMDMTQMYHGGLVRTEASGMLMLTDPKAGTQTILMSEQKMYMVMDMKEMAERAKGMKNKSDTTTPKITAEGTTETIAGKSCDNYLVVTQLTREICVAKGMGNIMMAGGGGMMGPGGQGGAGMDASAVVHPEYAEFFKGGFFPLKVSDVEGTNKKVKLLATKVEAKSLDPALFQVPAGYTEFKMPAMPGHHRG